MFYYKVCIHIVKPQIDHIHLLLTSASESEKYLLYIQWNLSVATTFIITYTTYDLFSDVL